MAAGLPIDPSSVEKRDPPEPDILCSTVSGQEFAFELTELVNHDMMSRNARQGDCQEFLENALICLSPVDQQAVRERLHNADICFCIRAGARTNQIRLCLHEILSDLLDLPRSFVGEITAFSSPNVRRVLQSVDVLRGEFQGPCFSVENLGGVGDPATGILRAKLQKRYVTTASIDLVAYLDRAGTLPDAYWRRPLSELFVDPTVLGPFARIWIFNLRAGKIECTIPN